MTKISISDLQYAEQFWSTELTKEEQEKIAGGAVGLPLPGYILGTTAGVAGAAYLNSRYGISGVARPLTAIASGAAAGALGTLAGAALSH